MNFSRTVSYLLLLMLAVGCQKDFAPENPSASSDEKDDGIIRGELLLKLDRETADALHPARTRSGELRTGNLDFDEICRRYSVVGMERVFEDNGCAERTRKAGLDLWYTVTFEGSARQIEADFRDAPGVSTVETPVRIRRVETGTPVLVDPSMIRPAATRSVPEDYPFNDPMFEAQWPPLQRRLDRLDGTCRCRHQHPAGVGEDGRRSDIIVVVVDEGVPIQPHGSGRQHVERHRQELLPGRQRVHHLGYGTRHPCGRYDCGGEQQRTGYLGHCPAGPATGTG